MELMEFLCRVMENLSQNGVPIVFKGAMVLNLVIQEDNPSGVERKTQDIDGDWVGTSPTMEQMKKALEKAVNDIDTSLKIEIKREYGEKKSAGFVIIDEEGKKVASVDISVRKNDFSYPYISYINNVAITGASLNKMLADKICAVSNNYVFRRTKDLVDLYVLSFIVECSAKELIDIWDKIGRKPDKFIEFYTRTDEISAAYGKLTGVTNKPEFSALYARVSEFLSPFSDLEKNKELKWTKDGWHDTNIDKQLFTEQEQTANYVVRRKGR
jgi:hypothetical protein